MPADRSTPTSRRAYGASSGPHRPVPQPASSTSRLFAGSIGQCPSSIAATSAGARYDSLASFESKLAAKLSKVRFDVAHPTPAPAPRARCTPPACAARSDCPGSSASHSSKISRALSISPSVQCASASSRRASGCFGLQRDHLAEAGDRFLRPLLARSAGCRGWCRRRCARGSGESPCDRRPRLPTSLPVRPQQHAEIAVGVGMVRVRARWRAGTPRSPPRAALAPGGRCRGCCSSPA